MIAISADFDPVHKGHEELIRKAREIADGKGIEVAIYMNKGYSANHAPFFTPFEASPSDNSCMVTPMLLIFLPSTVHSR